MKITDLFSQFQKGFFFAVMCIFKPLYSADLK